MTKQLKELLIGIILGDAHIQRVGLNKAFITFEQSSKKSEYINFVFNQVKEGGLPLLKDQMVEYSRNDSRHNTINKSLYFKSESIEEFRFLADMFLDSNGKKIIPQNISEHLTHRSLAF